MGRRVGVLVPSLGPFSGSMLPIGPPMFRVSRPLWGVTVAAAARLVGEMVLAERHGVG